jgi:LL-diaminopimelate aminotransferase
MMKINTNYLQLDNSYLFSAVARKVADYKQQNPEKTIIRLGIGDVTLPLPPVVVEAMKKAVGEMADSATFRGYGDEQGYQFLRAAVQSYYKGKQVKLDEDEIFISDGAKSDLGNILDIFSADNVVLVPDPVYPVYVDTNIMAGRKIVYLKGDAGNHFLPLPQEGLTADIIYLCSPNNPTGAVYDKDQLQRWVDFALAQGAVILFDAAYEAFVQDPDIPTSIYEIAGAHRCAIEFCSLSKTAGFTGTRCGYTIVPLDLTVGGAKLRDLWLRRQTTKFNGVPYVVQRGAEAVFTPEGFAQTRANIAYYLENARLIRAGLEQSGIDFVGGKHSPYIWMQCPQGMNSWDYFDHLLNQAQVVGTPGVGFGSQGEGFFRLTAFGKREDVVEALQRMKR